MKALYEKSEISFALAWIVAYCVLASLGDYLSDIIGVQKMITLPILILLSGTLFYFVRKHQLLETYGLCKSEIPVSKMLYYIPLAALLTVNLWEGFGIKMSVPETLFYMLSMLCVGFLEEMIFADFYFVPWQKMI